MKLEHIFNLALHLAAIGHAVILCASVQVPTRLRWREDFARLNDFNRKLVWVYAGFTAGTIAAFGILTAVLHDELLRGDRAALALAWFIGIYWTVRLLIDVCWFGHRDWPAGRRFVVAHALLFALFVALAGTYIGLAVWRA